MADLGGTTDALLNLNFFIFMGVFGKNIRLGSLFGKFWIQYRLECWLRLKTGPTITSLLRLLITARVRWKIIFSVCLSDHRGGEGRGTLLTGPFPGGE